MSKVQVRQAQKLCCILAPDGARTNTTTSYVMPNLIGHLMLRDILQITLL